MKHVATILITVVLAACGTNTHSELYSATDSENNTVSSQAILLGVEARPVNGGINPDISAVKITGRVMLGGNSCDAHGKSATLEQSINGDTIEVVALIHTPASIEIRQCPRIFMPVYVPLTLTVSAQAGQNIIVKNVDTRGNEVSVEDLIHDAGSPEVILDVVARPVNGGINPDMAAVAITGRVLLGNNSCEAEGMSATLEQSINGSTIEVVALVRAPAPIVVRQCPRIFLPVYADLALTVSAHIDQYIVVKNVDVRGNDVHIEELLDEGLL